MAAKLSLVTGEQPAVKPPRKLGKHGAHLWKTVLDEYQIEDAGGVEMLASACQALDRAERCREAIDNEGEMIRTKAAGPRDHPLLKHELAARSFVVRMLQRLGLNMEAIKPTGRPPRGLGWLPDADD
jgi:phage terminase small subunit